MKLYSRTSIWIKCSSYLILIPKWFVIEIFLGVFLFAIPYQSLAQIGVKIAFPNLSFVRPVDLQHPGDGTDRLFVIEQRGVISVFENNLSVTSSKVFLDIQDRVKDDHHEEGLLGLAFHPDYKDNGYFYVNYTASNPRRTVIARYIVSAVDPDSADEDSEFVILEIEQPTGNHNGGQLRFGPDGYLYIGMGDGGPQDDALGNGQNLETLLGSILRIDVDITEGDKNYGIPADNPFAGNPKGLDEIYAYGFRNPWRFSFDPVTNWLWLADVGQHSYEEINIIESGGNYGWNIMEGLHCFNPPINCDTTGLELPIWEYGHGPLGHAIIGGFVYRGNNILELRDAYIYADYISGRIWSLRYDGINPVENTELINTDLFIASFGTDKNNELYICAFDGKIYRLNTIADAPTLTVSDTTGDEDTAIGLTINAMLVDTDGSETLSITIDGVPQGAILSAGTNNGLGSWTLTPADLTDLTITPPADSHDDLTLAVTATSTEGSNNDTASTSANLKVTVNPVNDEPSFVKGSNQTVNEDAGAQTVAGWATNLSKGPADESGQTLTFTVTTDNDSFFSVLPAIDAISGDLTYTPAADANGSATVSVVLTDDGGVANGGDDTFDTQTFTITITAVNDEPSFVKGANQTANEDAGPQTVTGWATNLSKGPADESGQTLTFTVTTDNDSLFSVLPVIDSTSGNLTYTPAANANGSATISVVLTDDGGVANGGDDTFDTQTFTITANPVNDEPSFIKGTDQTVNEDVGAQTITGWATNISKGPVDESGQILTFTVTTDNDSLFSVQPSVDTTSGDLTYTPIDDANGSAIVSVILTDDGGTANGGDDTFDTQTFTITVNPVNDEPSFVKGVDQTVNADAGAQTVAGWATGISKGPQNESGQTLTFTVTIDNDSIFSVLPAIDPASGDLTYTPAKSGGASVTVVLTDNGGTANGGDDTFAAQTFTIKVFRLYTLTINSDPTGIAIAGGTTPFSERYTSGTTLILAAPDTFGTQGFDHWVVDGENKGSDVFVTLTMDADHTITAHYKQAVYSLTVNSSPMERTITVSPVDNVGNGDGATPLSREYNSGATVTLTTLSAFDNQVFDHWEMDDENVGSDLSMTVTMDANRTITAHYILVYTLTINSDSTEVSISVSPADNDGNGDGTTSFSRKYRRGTAVTLTAPSDLQDVSAMQLFDHWEIDGLQAGENQTLTFTVDADKTATAHYIPVYTLTVNSDSTAVKITVAPADLNENGDGTTSFSRKYKRGTAVTLTTLSRLQEESGTQVFDHWVVDGEDVGEDETITLPMDADHTTTARYLPVYTLTVNSFPAGISIMASPADLNGNGDGATPLSREYKRGTTVTLTTPGRLQGESGTQVFDHWVVDGEGVESDETTVVIMNIDTTATAQYKTLPEFVVGFPKGIGLIHVPLKVTMVEESAMKIQTIGDLYNALGGAENVDFIITRDALANVWRSYLGNQNRGSAADRTITDDLGMITLMKNPVTLRFTGEALGSDGVSAVHLNPGTNLIGVPLVDERLKRVSDLLSLDGIKDNATAIIVSDEGTFKIVAQANDDGDIPITGGQSFILIARDAGVAEIIGEAWDNVSGSPPAAPPMVLVSHQVDGQTPVLAVRGVVIDEVTGVAKDGYHVTVRNLSTGATLSTLSGSDIPEGRYSLTFVDTISSRAARVGDVLKITVQTRNPLIGVQPLRHIVSTDDVNGSQIRLPDLIAYEIPTETRLLTNYPNPFNPETWIPFRLAKDAFVTLTIYDMTGAVVRTIEVGHKPAAVYESRDKAIYFDGRNDFGERVASGVYFYHLSADDSYATRKMLILK